MRTFGKHWSYDDLSLFGTLGLGSGGFGPLYPVNFSEITRLIINGLESDRVFYPGGLGQLVDGLVSQINQAQATSGGRYRFFPNCTVGGIVNIDNKVVLSVNDDMLPQELDIAAYDSAIVAKTTRSMQIDINMTEKPEAGVHPVLNEENKAAIERLHVTSKLFVLTKTKFWKGKDIPQNIQTDGLVRGLYCLDYPLSDYGVVLISYTWGDDSTKLLALQDPCRRMEHLLRSLETSS